MEDIGMSPDYGRPDVTDYLCHVCNTWRRDLDIETCAYCGETACINCCEKEGANIICDKCAREMEA